MAIDRYKSIQKTSRNEKSIRSYVKVSLLIWLFSVLVCSPLTYGRTETARGGNFYCDVYRWPYYATLVYYSMFSTINYILPLFVLLFTQIKLSRILEHNHIPRVRTPRNMSLQHVIRRKNGTVGGLDVAQQRPDRSKSSVVSNSIDRSCLRGSVVDMECKGENREVDSENQETNSGNQQPSAANRRLRKIGQPNVTNVNHQRAILDAVRVKRNREAIRRLSVITGTFVVLWTPMVVMRFAYYSYQTIHPVFFLCAKGIAFASTLANFFIYPKFRRSLLDVCKKRCRVRRRDNVLKSREVMGNPYVITTV